MLQPFARGLLPFVVCGLLVGPLPVCRIAVAQDPQETKEAPQETKEATSETAQSGSDSASNTNTSVTPPALDSKAEKSLDKNTNTPSVSGLNRQQILIASLTVFVLAVFVGFEIINKVPPTLHTPLMSGSNAISGITIVGALIVGGMGAGFARWLGWSAVVLAMINVVGGFVVTHRMLAMFKRR